MLSAPRTYKRDPVAGNWLRELFATLFRERRHEMTLQIVKGMNPLYADANKAEREEIVREFKLVLISYLSSRLRPDWVGDGRADILAFKICMTHGSSTVEYKASALPFAGLLWHVLKVFQNAAF